MISCKVLVH